MCNRHTPYNYAISERELLDPNPTTRVRGGNILQKKYPPSVTFFKINPFSSSLLFVAIHSGNGRTLSAPVIGAPVAPLCHVDEACAALPHRLGPTPHPLRPCGRSLRRAPSPVAGRDHVLVAGAEQCGLHRRGRGAWGRTPDARRRAVASGAGMWRRGRAR
jgi:hypothetical protein